MAIDSPKTIIIIAGPTAVGKTAVALAVAKHFNTSIISADSRQCFRELSIGVARPTPEELKQIKHYFIASHSINDDVTAMVFEQYALRTAHELFTQHDTVVMTGGTGLYIKAFCEGLDEIPAISPEIRASILSGYESGGIAWLQQELNTKDPSYYANGEIQNPQRMMRALEVVAATGVSILDFRKGNKITRDFKIVKIGLELRREELYNRINDRVDHMMDAGLLDEVKGLMSFRHLNALQTVGYAELFDYLDNNISLDKATGLIKQNTRRYAKRQMTWFKKDAEIKWFESGEAVEIINFLEKK